MMDDSTGLNGLQPHSRPSSTPWKASGPVAVNPEDSAAFIAETCQRMAMVLPHYLIPLYAKRDAIPEDQDPPMELMHMIATLEMTTIGVAMIETSNQSRLCPAPNLTVLKGGLLDATGNPIQPA